MKIFKNMDGKKDKRKITGAGFTLVETIVAIAILMLGMMGVTSLATTSIRSMSHIRNQFTASFLAEEGLEYIRNKRDEAVLLYPSDVAFLDRLEDIGICVGQLNGCYIDVTNDDIVLCGSEGCPKIKFDQTSGFFGYTLGPDSQFTRTITVNTISDIEVEIESEVTWPGYLGATDSVNIKSRLFDWLP